MSQVGTRLSCAACGSQGIVIAASAALPSCSGQAMSAGAAPAGGPSAPGHASGNQIGKRYRCELCAQVILCTRAGAGPFTCHDRDMIALAPQQLPAGD